MEPRGRRAPAREDEAAQLGQLLVEAVAVALERVHLLLRDPQPPVAGAVRHGEVGADVEELVLDALERRAQRGRELAGERDAELRVQLVDGAERADPAVELRGPAAVAEARLARVAAARVDPGQADGLVAAAHGPRVRT